MPRGGDRTRRECANPMQKKSRLFEMAAISVKSAPTTAQRALLSLLAASLYVGAAVGAWHPRIGSAERTYVTALLCGVIVIEIGVLARRHIYAIAAWSFGGGLAGLYVLPATSMTRTQRELALESQTIWDSTSIFACLCAGAGTIIGLNIEVIRRALNSWNRKL